MVAVYSDDYTTSDVNMAGSLTQATYAPETVGGGTVAKYTNVQGIEISPNNPVVLPTTADQTPKLHFDIWRSPTDQDADLMIALTNGVPAFLGGRQSNITATVSADSIPASQWVTVEVPVTADPIFDVVQVMMTPMVPGSEGSIGGLLPTPVMTDAIYLDNIYFSNGNDVAAPTFEIPTSIDLGFTAQELEGFDITSFGAATAEVKASPNGDQAIEVVKPAGAETWAGVTMWYPAAADQVSLVTDQHHDVVLNVYAPAAGETVRLKLENNADGSKFIETDVVTTTAGWQTVRFDFSDQIDPAAVYDKASVFPSFGDTGTGQTYFFDDVKFLDAVPEFVIPTVNVAMGLNGIQFHCRW